MAVLIALGIAAAVVAFVVAPLFLVNGRPSQVAAEDVDTFETLGELVAEKETLYAAIQELDFDLKSGKLSAEDYDALRQRYEIQAAVVLKRIDEVQQASRQPGKPLGARREKRKG
jgi:cell shape-determining protein MreC